MRAVFLDLDGTLYNGDYKIDYADTMIARLREAQIPFLFLTNNSSRTPEMVATHLMELGIPARAEEVFHSARATALYVQEQWQQSAKNRVPKVYCIGEVGMRSSLELANVTLVEEEQPDFVVQGIDRNVTYEKLKKAVQFILAGARFVLTNPDLLLPWNRQFLPGAGSIGAMLSAATGVQPVTIGKPSPIIMRYALAHLNDLLAERQGAMARSLLFADVWMIGDNLRTDIAAAHAVSSVSALVLTGLVKPDQAAAFIEDVGIRPHHIFPNLKSCTDAILSSDYR